MSYRYLLRVLAGIVAVSWGAWATDYRKIERTIAKEPTYGSTAPKYALLIFGPEAKIRVWVVLDGETVYLDRNADGDLTGMDERFEKSRDCKNVEIRDPDGKTRYVITGLDFYKQGDPPRTQMSVDVDIKGPVEYQEYCDAALEENPRKAPLAHFHGPLTIGPRTINWEVSPEFALAVGEKPTDLFANIGTMSAEYGCWVVVRTHDPHSVEKSLFAEGVLPVVVVEYQAKKQGEPPLKKRYELDKFC